VNPDFSDPVGWQGTQSAGNPGDYMRVRVAYQFQFLTPGVHRDAGERNDAGAGAIDVQERAVF
jgi:hypothetical protein